MESFDYIIVGAGSAGCVLSNRLSEDTSCRVLVLECGGEDDSPLIHTPGTYSMLQDSPLDWGYRTVPQSNLGMRRIFSPRGRVLGGSSSINYMMYVRGNQRDFDQWLNLGNLGWGYADILPYFKRSEDNQDIHNDWHGKGGPLTVTNVPIPNPLSERYLDAAQQAGLPFNPDFNGNEQYGCGFYQRTIRNGMRCSAAVAYLHPARSRPNLTVRTHAHVTRLLIENGRIVRGVEYFENHRLHQAFADGDVVLSGGAFNSPQLLMLSGIGSAQELGRLGIKVQQDLSGVGKNLQDHFGVRMGCEINQPLSFSALPSTAKAEEMAQYTKLHTGPLSGNFLEVGAFTPDTVGGELWPSLQYFFFPTMPSYYPEAGPRTTHGLGFACYLNRPQSTGQVTLSSANPFDRPLIDPNYLAVPEDLRILKAGVRLNLKLLQEKAFDSLRTGITFPDNLPDSDASLETFIRREGSTFWHVSGTCRMGNDTSSVVDPMLRVHGMEGLRIVDASVMPRVVSANINASVIMLAEKASDMIRGLPSLST